MITLHNVSQHMTDLQRMEEYLTDVQRQGFLICAQERYDIVLDTLKELTRYHLGMVQSVEAIVNEINRLDPLQETLPDEDFSTSAHWSDYASQGAPGDASQGAPGDASQGALWERVPGKEQEDFLTIGHI